MMIDVRISQRGQILPFLPLALLRQCPVDLPWVPEKRVNSEY